MAEEVQRIATEKLLPNPYQPRKQFKSEEPGGIDKRKRNFAAAACKANQQQ